MRMGGTTRAISLAILVLVFGLLQGSARAQSVGALSPQCANIDFTSAQSLFECMGTIRHRKGTSKFARMDGRRCAEIIQQLMREIGQIKAFRDETQPIPSCEVVAEAAEMMTGNAPFWSPCTGYPGSDPTAHMRTCMEAFAPGYYGTRRFPPQLATCEEFRRGYELALQFANNRHNQRVPEGYSPPPCDVAKPIIAGLTGTEPQWSGCANYNPSNVREHLLACVGSSPQDFLNLRDCAAVRSAYELRLRATHGGLPANYSVLSCGDAQAVLDAAAAYKEAEEARRVARAEAVPSAHGKRPSIASAAASRRRGRRFSPNVKRGAPRRPPATQGRTAIRSTSTAMC